MIDERLAAEAAAAAATCVPEAALVDQEPHEPAEAVNPEPDEPDCQEDEPAPLEASVDLPASVTSEAEPSPVAPAARDWIVQAQPWRLPTPTFLMPSAGPRLSLMLADIDPKIDDPSLTVVVLAIELANALGASLRLIGSQSPPNADSFVEIFRTVGSGPIPPIETVHLPADGYRHLAVTPDDRFLSTCWRATAGLLGSVPRHRICHFATADDAGDCQATAFRLARDQTLLARDLLVIAEAVPGRDGQLTPITVLPPPIKPFLLEPVLPAGSVQLLREHSKPLRLLVHARAERPESRYPLAVEAVIEAVLDGTLSAEEWQLVFHGAERPVVMPRNIAAEFVTDSSGKAFRRLLAAVDAVFLPDELPLSLQPLLEAAAAEKPVLVAADQRFDVARLGSTILNTRFTPPAISVGLAWLTAPDRSPAAVPPRAAERDWRATMQKIINQISHRFCVGQTTTRLPGSHGGPAPHRQTG